MKRYLFCIEIEGEGETIDEAFDKAVDAFDEDRGDTPILLPEEDYEKIAKTVHGGIACERETL